MAINLDLVDVRLLVNIADTNSLTHGAERCYISVPAASARIKHLEDNLGIRLFYRSAKGVTLTPAGEVFLHHARLMLQQVENLSGDLQKYVRGIKGSVRISASTSPAFEFLPAVLPEFLATHPDVAVDLRERTSYDIVHDVREGKADIGIVADLVSTQGLEVLPYRSYRLVLATARNHPLSNKCEASFDETLDFDYVSLREATAVHSLITHAAHDLNHILRVRIQVGSFEAVCRMIEANVGIGVLPESVAQRYSRIMSIHVVRLTDNWASGNLQICVRNLLSLPTFARELVDLLLASVKEPAVLSPA